jgi:PAS domain-containing protein
MYAGRLQQTVALLPAVDMAAGSNQPQRSGRILGVTNQELRNRNRELLESNDDLRQSCSYQDAIVETLRESLLVLDANLRVQKANREFYETFHVRPEETLKQHIYDLGNGQWDIPELRKLLENCPQVSGGFYDLRFLPTGKTRQPTTSTASRDR